MAEKFPPLSAQDCGSCRYSREPDDYMICCRHAPSPADGSRWPLVHPSDWCGEWCGR